MSEKDIKEMITIVDTLTLEELMENAKDWDFSLNTVKLIYPEKLLPQKFEEAADDQSGEN